MSATQSKTLVLYVGDPNDQAGQKVVATVTAARVVLVSQYMDLRDEHGKLIATLTWTSPVKAREI